MKKEFFGIFFLLILLALWYLFIKPSDYTVRFEAKTFPGAINQTLKLWDRTLDTVEPIAQENDLFHLTQNIRFGDSIHQYRWIIKPLTDSTSKVTVNIKDKEHSFWNKLKVPFSDTNFEKRSRKTVFDFMENLQDHVDKFKVTIIGEAVTPGKYFAYVPVKVTQFQKAGGMMKYLPSINSVLLKNKVSLNGPPIIEITQWNQINDSLYYNFGQPIFANDSLPQNQGLEYKQLKKRPALKAIYNGNYITSDRAWYALLDYADKNGIAVEKNALEVFFNNPNMGGNDIEWKAEIYLPIIEDNE
ncbi:MAG: GyrI-like domain-containing protein [Croceitalea sp.]|nr:GyrI-like domain-containing protein [Croceitalea sp.]